MTSILKKVLKGGGGGKRSHSPPPVTPPSPDLSHLTSEELSILADVLKRQEQFEKQEHERVRRLEAEMVAVEQEVKSSQPEKGKKWRLASARLCRICYKTRMSEGAGRSCGDCRKRVCGRCGSYSRHKGPSQKPAWLCRLCLLKREVTCRTGGWYHGARGPQYPHDDAHTAPSAADLLRRTLLGLGCSQDSGDEQDMTSGDVKGESEPAPSSPFHQQKHHSREPPARNDAGQASFTTPPRPQQDHAHQARRGHEAAAGYRASGSRRRSLTLGGGAVQRHAQEDHDDEEENIQDILLERKLSYRRRQQKKWRKRHESRFITIPLSTSPEDTEGNWGVLTSPLTPDALPGPGHPLDVSLSQDRGSSCRRYSRSNSDGYDVSQSGFLHKTASTRRRVFQRSSGSGPRELSITVQSCSFSDGDSSHGQQLCRSNSPSPSHSPSRAGDHCGDSSLCPSPTHLDSRGGRGSSTPYPYHQPDHHHYTRPAHQQRSRPRGERGAGSPSAESRGRSGSQGQAVENSVNEPAFIRKGERRLFSSPEDRLAAGIGMRSASPSGSRRCSRSECSGSGGDISPSPGRRENQTHDASPRPKKGVHSVNSLGRTGDVKDRELKAGHGDGGVGNKGAPRGQRVPLSEPSSPTIVHGSKDSRTSAAHSPSTSSRRNDKDRQPETESLRDLDSVSFHKREMKGSHFTPPSPQPPRRASEASASKSRCDSSESSRSEKLPGRSYSEGNERAESAAARNETESLRRPVHTLGEFKIKHAELEERRAGKSDTPSMLVRSQPNVAKIGGNALPGRLRKKGSVSPPRSDSLAGSREVPRDGPLSSKGSASPRHRSPSPRYSSSSSHRSPSTAASPNPSSCSANTQSVRRVRSPPEADVNQAGVVRCRCFGKDGGGASSVGGANQGSSLRGGDLLKVQGSEEPGLETDKNLVHTVLQKPPNASAEAFGFRVTGGTCDASGALVAVIKDVTAGSPAQTAGLQPGDVVVEWNGQELGGASYEMVQNIVNSTRVDSLHLFILPKACVGTASSPSRSSSRHSDVDKRSGSPPSPSHLSASDTNLPASGHKRRMLPKTPVQIGRESRHMSGELMLSLDYDPTKAILYVTVVMARDLAFPELESRGQSRSQSRQEHRRSDSSVTTQPNVSPKLSVVSGQVTVTGPDSSGPESSEKGAEPALPAPPTSPSLREPPHVTVHKAEHSSSGVEGAEFDDDFLTVPSPFVLVHLLPNRKSRESHKTEPRRHNRKPEWEQTFVYDNFTITELVTRSLEVTVWSRADSTVPSSGRLRARSARGSGGSSTRSGGSEQYADEFLGEVLIELRDWRQFSQPTWCGLEDHDLNCPPLPRPRQLLAPNDSLASSASSSYYDDLSGRSPEHVHHPQQQQQQAQGQHQHLHKDGSGSRDSSQSSSMPGGDSIGGMLSRVTRGMVKSRLVTRVSTSFTHADRKGETGSDESSPGEAQRRRSVSDSHLLGPEDHVTSPNIQRRPSATYTMDLLAPPRPLSRANSSSSFFLSDDSSEGDPYSPSPATPDRPAPDGDDITSILGPGQVPPRPSSETMVCGDIKVGLAVTKGQLEVDIVCVRGLQRSANLQPPDTYVKTYLVEGKKTIQKKKSQVVKASTDPIFRRKIKYSACNVHGRHMRIMVWEKPRNFERKQSLGETVIRLDALDLAAHTMTWYKLFPVNSTDLGSTDSLTQW